MDLRFLTNYCRVKVVTAVDGFQCFTVVFNISEYKKMRENKVIADFMENNTIFRSDHDSRVHNKNAKAPKNVISAIQVTFFKCHKHCCVLILQASGFIVRYL